MPRVSDAHRTARREQIAEAALRVLARHGSETSIAQIVEECGLSAGAIYGNFENKADLARFIAGRLLQQRLRALQEAFADGAVRTPEQVLRAFLTSHPSPVHLSVLLQFWGEATVDPELHAVVTERIGQLRDTFAAALEPWAAGRPGGGPELARRCAELCVAMTQGFLIHTALCGSMTDEEYVCAATVAFGTTPDPVEAVGS